MSETNIEMDREPDDSINEIKEYWGESGIDEIHNRILQWKQQHA